MTKTFKFEVDNETYEMTMDKLASSITREFAKELLNEKDFLIFCERQNVILKLN